MLTRAGVAKRLKRSIATVRRMEGRELHPWTDSRGVHQFDGGEVEQVARAEHDRDPHGDELAASLADANEGDARRRVERLGLELNEAREACRVASERSAELESQNRELRTTAIEALEMVEVVLGSGTPYEVRHCLCDLRRHR